MSTVIQAYRFALDPTWVQVEALRSHCGGQRFAFNWGLGRVRANLAQREAERSYGIGEAELTPSLSWSAYSLRKAWNVEKYEVAPWWAENSKEAYSCGLANLADGLGNWNASRTGKRRGPTMRFPTRKSKRATAAVRFSTGAFGLAASDRRHVKLPRIGLVRTHESTRKLARHVESGRARIRSATVSFRRGRWQVSFSVEIDRAEPRPASRGGTVGVDLGVKHLAVLSTGETVANPKHLQTAQRELRRVQRQAARRWVPGRRPEEQSRRWHQSQARIAKLHAYVANARADGLHKLSTRLTAEFDTIVVEDLNVAGMLTNPRLARIIADVGMGELRRQIDYKTKLRLSERTFTCNECGHVLDRDRNAAHNLANLVEAAGGTSSPSCGATVNEPAGNPRKTTTPREGVQGSGYRHGKTPRVNAA